MVARIRISSFSRKLVGSDQATPFRSILCKKVSCQLCFASDHVLATPQTLHVRLIGVEIDAHLGVLLKADETRFTHRMEIP